MQQPGRPREFDPDEVLSKIMQLFWENGYEGTGLSDIIAATGMGKASLYSAFGNKQEMYLKALARYEALMVDSAVAILRAGDRPPLERINAFLSAPMPTGVAVFCAMPQQTARPWTQRPVRLFCAATPRCGQQSLRR